MKKKNQNNQIKNFIVNKNRVLICLKFLCEKNPLYIANGIKIDYEIADKLPANGIPSELTEIIDMEITNENFCKEINSGIDNGPEFLENVFDDCEAEVNILFL